MHRFLVRIGNGACTRYSVERLPDIVPSGWAVKSWSGYELFRSRRRPKLFCVLGKLGAENNGLSSSGTDDNPFAIKVDIQVLAPKTLPSRQILKAAGYSLDLELLLYPTLPVQSNQFTPFGKSRVTGALYPFLPTMFPAINQAIVRATPSFAP